MSQRRKLKVRAFNPEFKLNIVERLLAGESATALADEVKTRRNIIYRWRDAYLAGGPEALRRCGRPRKRQAAGPAPDPKTERAELLQARQRIAELERKVGHQEMQIDFFVEALRRIDAVREERKGNSARRCTPSSENKCNRAD